MVSIAVLCSFFFTQLPSIPVDPTRPKRNSFVINRFCQLIQKNPLNSRLTVLKQQSLKIYGFCQSLGLPFRMNFNYALSVKAVHFVSIILLVRIRWLEYIFWTALCLSLKDERTTKTLNLWFPVVAQFIWQAIMSLNLKATLIFWRRFKTKDTKPPSYISNPQKMFYFQRANINRKMRMTCLLHVLVHEMFPVNEQRFTTTTNEENDWSMSRQTETVLFAYI